MRHRVYGIALITTMLAVGAGLASFTGSGFSAPSGALAWASVTASLLGAGVLFVGMVRRATSRNGMIVLAGSSAMLGVSVAFVASAELAGLAADWASAANLEPAALTNMVRLLGSLGMVVGCGMWTVGLFDSPKRADNRRAFLEDRVTELRTRIKSLKQQLQEATTTDPLTGTLNRRTFLERVDETIQRDIRLGTPMAFLLVDIVGFRALNGRLGRHIGDHVLQQVGTALRSTTRGTDFVGRVGGDEFGVVLAECDDAQPAITRIMLALDEVVVPDEQGRDGRRTIPLAVHIGCVEIPNAASCRGFGQLFLLAEERVRSLREIPKSHMSKIKLEGGGTSDVAAG